MSSIVKNICRTCIKAIVYTADGAELNSCPDVKQKIFILSEGEYCPAREEDQSKFIKIKIIDEGKDYILDSSSDCVWVCASCGAERPVLSDDIRFGANNDEITSGTIKPPKCNCGRVMRFSYWLDRFYDEFINKKL